MKHVGYSASKAMAGAMLLAILVVSGAGCEDGVTSPCYDCIPNHEFTCVDERTFLVEEDAAIRVHGFAGRVTYRTGPAGVVRVESTLHAAARGDLDRIDVAMVAHANTIEVLSSNPLGLDGVSVDFDIVAPADAVVSIEVGAGEIRYRGRPAGTQRFKTGVGTVSLELPADVAVTIDLVAVVGSVEVGFPLENSEWTYPSRVRGTIGSGGDAHIQASTAVGNIHVSRIAD